MIFNNNYSHAYVWVWLPTKTTPVVAGKLTIDGDNLMFNYGQSYLENKNSISIYEPELPLKKGILPLGNGLSIPGCIRDAAPDAWGRRVLLNMKYGLKSTAIDTGQYNELDFLLESGSDRIGALDFQLSPTEYLPRLAHSVPLIQLLESADRVEKGLPLNPELDRALLHGSSIGGARPKALIEDDSKKYIAKFSSTSDYYNVIKAEYLAMKLAATSGISTAKVHLKKVMERDVLLIERFDRELIRKTWHRKYIVSALTIFGLDEMMARYASYEDLAEIIRFRFKSPKKTLQELFKRMVFNILSGNTDDHARNHAAFWDGNMLSLTPAYDICPQPRAGNIVSQAMLIHGTNRMSQISTCIKSASSFLLTEKKANLIIETMLNSILKNWPYLCDRSELSIAERRMLGSRQFLNPYVYEDMSSSTISKLCKDFEKIL